MWTLLAIFIKTYIGIILYFLLRDPLPTPCPKCGLSGSRRFFLLPEMRHGDYCAHVDMCHKKLETRLGELRVLRGAGWWTGSEQEGKETAQG